MVTEQDFGPALCIKTARVSQNLALRDRITPRKNFIGSNYIASTDNRRPPLFATAHLASAVCAVAEDGADEVDRQQVCDNVVSSEIVKKPMDFRVCVSELVCPD